MIKKLNEDFDADDDEDYMRVLPAWAESGTGQGRGGHQGGSGLTSEPVILGMLWIS